MTVRHHPITGEPIVFAPGRAERPNAFGRKSEEDPCPFCPGNEHLTPQEIAVRGDPWRVRVFPNKYPAVAGHELIVESSDHSEQVLRGDHAVEVVETYVERYRVHSSTAGYVSLFRNHGERAGASIDHIHSQLMPLMFVPPRVAREAASFGVRVCPLCQPGSPLGAAIDEDEHFRRLAPYGSSHAWQQWIVPRRHQSDITSMTHAEVASLAVHLERAQEATSRIAPSSNLLLMNFPPSPATHFYIELFPRMTAIAGFELGSGTFIDIIDPAAAARALR